MMDKESFENLSSDVNMISEANCLMNGIKVACATNGDFKTSDEFQYMSSSGFSILGANANVGDYRKMGL